MKTLSLLLLGALLVGCQSQDASGAAIAALSSTALASKVPTLTVRVEGLTCEGCAWQIRESLQGVPGVLDVRTSVETKQVVIAYDPERVSPAKLKAALKKAGYEATEGS